MSRSILPWLALLALCMHGASAQDETTDRPATGQAEEAAPEVDMTIRERGGTVFSGEPVNRVFVGSIDRWQVLDDRRLLLYRTRSRPYLVTLSNRAPQLRWNAVIGLKLRDRSLDARFDSIYVDGFPYRIQRIEKITPETAALLEDMRRARRDAGRGPAPGEDEDPGR